MISASEDPIVLSGMVIASPERIASGLGTCSLPTGASELELRKESIPTGPGRLLDRPSTITIDTIEALVGGEPGKGPPADCPPARRGLVLGSGAAGIDQSMTVTTESLTRTRPYNVNPALVPACVMNYSAAQCAIRFDLQGPNVTVTAGRVTGIAALGYADRAIRRNRADLVICGAFEDLNDRRIALAELTAPRSAPGEGCCAFLVERASRAEQHGRPKLAELLALESGVVTSPGDEHVVIGAVVDRALAGADLKSAEIAVVSGDAGDASAADRAMQRDADLIDTRPLERKWIRPAETVGDTLGATAAFQIAAAVLTEPASGSQGEPVMVIVTDPDGQVGCAILRREP